MKTAELSVGENQSIKDIARPTLCPEKEKLQQKSDWSAEEKHNS